MIGHSQRLRPKILVALPNRGDCFDDAVCQRWVCKESSQRPTGISAGAATRMRSWTPPAALLVVLRNFVGDAKTGIDQFMACSRRNPTTSCGLDYCHSPHLIEQLSHSIHRLTDAVSSIVH